MEGVDDIGVRRMVFGALLVVLEEARAHQSRRRRDKPGRVLREHLLAEIGEGRAPDRRGRPGKSEVHHVVIEPDDFEDLRPLVAIECRDAHLREHLQGAVLERLDVVLLRAPAIGGLPFQMAGRC